MFLGPGKIPAHKRCWLKSKKPPPGYRKAANDARKRALERVDGSQGAASPVRKIDPATGNVIAVLGSKSS
jgi:hypothetical protein